MVVGNNSEHLFFCVLCTVDIGDACTIVNILLYIDTEGELIHNKSNTDHRTCEGVEKYCSAESIYKDSSFIQVK